MEKKFLEWEVVYNRFDNKTYSQYPSYRARVLGGWLFKSSDKAECAPVFIPDPEYAWVI